MRKHCEQHAKPDADDSQMLADDQKARRRYRQAKSLRQHERLLRLARLGAPEPLYWPLRKIG